MDLKIKLSFIILAFLVISCQNQEKQNELPPSDQLENVKENKKESEIEESKLDESKIINQLQGKWKEIEYPYRTAEFVQSTLKFVEEGIVDEPKFENFELSKTCRFDNNNIVDIKPSDIILTLLESNRCEKLQVSNDTLTLTGFSTNTNEDYFIIYKKIL